MADKLPTGRTGVSSSTSPKRMYATPETVSEYMGDSRTGAEKIQQSGPIYPIAGRRRAPVVEVGMSGPIPGSKPKPKAGRQKIGKTTKKGVYGKQKKPLNPGY